MNPKDAMRIAKYSRIGNCYEPSEQLKHGGMIFYTGPQIPNYNPDHGPTHADSKHDLAIFPPNMIQFTER